MAEERRFVGRVLERKLRLESVERVIKASRAVRKYTSMWWVGSVWMTQRRIIWTPMAFPFPLGPWVLEKGSVRGVRLDRFSWAKVIPNSSYWVLDIQTAQGT